MIFKKKKLNVLNQDIYFYGSELISILAIFVNALGLTKTNVENYSKSTNIINLINILKGFNVNIEINDNFLEINSKGILTFKQQENFVNIKTSREILYILIAIVSNYNFKTFLSSKKIHNIDISFFYKLLKNQIKIEMRDNSFLPVFIDGNEKVSMPNIIEVDDYLLKYFYIFLFLHNNKNDNLIINDVNIHNDYLEKLLIYYNVKVKERFYEKFAFFKQNNASCKEINIQYTDKIFVKDIIIPSDIKDIIYFIFLAMLIKDTSFYIKNVAINEYNDRIIKILLDAKVNLDLFNQKIMNSFKVCDISIKNSQLDIIKISESALVSVIEYYPLLIFISIFTGVGLELHGLKILLEKDKQNYDLMFSIINNFNIKTNLDNKNILKIEPQLEVNLKPINISAVGLDRKIMLPIMIINTFIDNYFNIEVDQIKNEDEILFFKDFCNYLNLSK